MKDTVRAEQPTAAQEWMKVTIYHVWVPRNTGDEFLWTTGMDPNFLVKPPLAGKPGATGVEERQARILQ